MAPLLLTTNEPVLSYSPPTITARPSARTAEVYACGSYPVGRLAICDQVPFR